MDGINSDGAIQMDNLAIANIRFDDATAANLDAGVITLTDLAATTTSFSFIGNGTLNDDLFFSPVTIDFDTSTDVANITLTVNNGGLVADDILIGAITADMVDQVTITATEVGAAAADELTITDLIVDKATDVVVTSNGEVIFSGMDGNVLDTLDMSGVDAGSTIQVDDAAAALTVTMGDGADNFTIADTTVAVTIDLGAGTDLFVSSTLDDTVTTGTGSDTVRFTGAATDDDNTVTDFTAGAGGDIIDLTTNNAKDSGTGSEVTVTAFGTITAAGELTNGMNIINVTAYTGAMTEAAVATELAADGVVSFADGDDAYFAIDNGTDTGIFFFEDGGTAAIAAGEIDLLVTLEGISDATALTAANFADFI